MKNLGRIAFLLVALVFTGCGNGGGTAVVVAPPPANVEAVVGDNSIGISVPDPTQPIGGTFGSEPIYLDNVIGLYFYSDRIPGPGNAIFGGVFEGRIEISDLPNNDSGKFYLLLADGQTMIQINPLAAQPRLAPGMFCSVDNVGRLSWGVTQDNRGKYTHQSRMDVWNDGSGRALQWSFGSNLVTFGGYYQSPAEFVRIALVTADATYEGQVVTNPWGDTDLWFVGLPEADVVGQLFVWGVGEDPTSDGSVLTKEAYDQVQHYGSNLVYMTSSDLFHVDMP
jgi:hypothetical protein